MLLVEVNFSEIAFFIAAQSFSQVVTKFITCDDVTRFDGTVPLERRKKILADTDSNSLVSNLIVLLMRSCSFMLNKISIGN